ncbi:MAG: hypothetical protein FJX02_05960 [Alphaproteobacteria bacterium]|nr:hypothetical protein [Alphaproteobacteria bacterium]
MNPSPSRMRRWLANAALFGVSTLVGFAFLEGTLRVLDMGFGEQPLLSDAYLHHRHPPDYRYRRRDGRGEFGGFIIAYDSQGRVIDPDARQVADPVRHHRRVAVLGDSMVEASQVAYRDSFVGLLNARAAPDVFADNWGVSSYSPVIYRLQWQREIAAGKPPLAIVMLYSNDVADDAIYAAGAPLDAAGLPGAVAGPPDSTLVRALRGL